MRPTLLRAVLAFCALASGALAGGGLTAYVPGNAPSIYKPGVAALREIAQGQVRFNESVEGTIRQYLGEIRGRDARPERSAGRQ